MIRVLQVFSVMNRGGSETMIMNYYRNIDRSKIQFDFVVHTKKKGAYDEEIKSLGGQIFHIPFFYGYNLFSYQKAWHSFFQLHPDYKIIHIHYFTIAGAILPIAKKYNITTRIVHSHIAVKTIPFIRFIRLHSLRFFAIRNATDRFACGSDAGFFFFKNKNFVVMNNAIDAEKFKFNPSLRNKIRSKLELNDKFVIGHIGRFNIQKNHAFVIDVFKEVLNLNKNAVLLLIGEGSLKQEMKDKVLNLGLEDKVIFTGIRPDIQELLQAMDVFLFPSLYEGLPVTIIEAQAAGLKIIASDTISKEANITDLVQNYSLEKSPALWAEIVYNNGNKYIHKDTLVEIIDAGFDIKSNVKWLENFYISKAI